MKGKKNLGCERVREGLIFLSLLILFSIVFLPSYGLGLELNIPNSSYTLNENESVNIGLNVSNQTGNVSFSENSQYANITKTSNTTANLSFILEEFCEKGTNEKNYIVEVRAEDENSTAEKDVNITVLRVNEEPIINNIDYDQEVYSDETTIGLSTNATYECKYDYSNKSFDDMRNEFHSISNTEYEATLEGLEQKSYSIFIRCIDECGNYMEQPERIGLEVNLPPSARISLHPKPPLKEGRVEVELSASESLSSAPELIYTFDNDRTPKPVSLIGGGKYWEGYLIIREDDVDKIGSFSFKGKDTTGIEGTEIKNGEIFLVDTLAPERIESLRIENQQDRIRLVWSYNSDDDIDEYKIYRKKGSGGTGLIDYYDKTDDTYYYDTDVEFNEAYYYKISAVDEAGNEGELSKEVFITFRPEEEEEQEESDEDEKEDTTKEEEKLKPTLMTELEDKLSEIDTWLLDIKGKIEEFGRIKDKDKITVIENMNILAKLKGTEQRLSSLRKEMAKLENQSLSDDEFESITKNAMEEARQAWENSIKHISVEDTEKYEEEINDEKTSLVFREYIAEKKMEVDEKIIKEVERAQDSITVESQILDVVANTFGNQSSNYLLVKKDISSSQPIPEARILEWIPLDLKGKIQEIGLLAQGEEVINKNLYSWNKNKLTSFSLAYSIKSDIRAVDLKDTKTVIFNEELLNDIAQDRENPITGAGTKEVEKDEGLHPLFIPMITAIVIAAALLSYYLFVVNKDNSIGKIKRYDRDESDKRLRIKDAEEEKGREEEKIRIRKEEYPKEVNKDRTFQKGDRTMRIEDEHPMISIYSYLANYKDDLEDKDEVGLNESETIKEHAKKIQLLCKEILAINTEKHAETTKRYILKALKQIEENDENKSKQDTKGSKHKLGLDKRKLLVKKGVVGRKEEVRKDTSNNAKTDNTSEEENKEHKAEESQMRAPEGKEFRLANGELITSINELVEKLEQMNDETFFQHIHENNEKMRNDFALWLRDVFDMEEDFSILNQTKDKAQFLEKIRKRI